MGGEIKRDLNLNKNDYVFDGIGSRYSRPDWDVRQLKADLKRLDVSSSKKVSLLDGDDMPHRSIAHVVSGWEADLVAGFKPIFMEILLRGVPNFYLGT